MNWAFLLIFFGFIFLAMPLRPAFADGVGPDPKSGGASCQAVVKDSHPRSTLINDFTNYVPWDGGINGHCGTSASGVNACNFPLESHQSGARKHVMLAAPRTGPVAGTFGGIYRLVPLENNGIKAKGGCVLGMVGDRLGPQANGKRHYDVVTRAKVGSELADKVNEASGTVYLVGTAEWYKQRHKPKVKQRKIARKPAAVSKVKKK